jgi:phosphatidyl-myo-inositol dimannoside synthase
MSYFLFITSDYKPMPGGVAEYIDNIARGLISTGTKIKVLAVVRPNESTKISFLEHYEEWVTPCLVDYDERPTNWLASKLVSILEIVRCLWPAARSLLDRTPLFRASSLSLSKLMGILTREKPSEIILGYLDLKLYPLVLYLRQHHLRYGIIAHDFEVRQSGARINDTVRRGMMLKNASWIAANSRHTKSLLESWGIPTNKMMVIHPPLSEQALKGLANRHLINRDGQFNLITIARLVKPKGIDIVLRALALLDERQIPYQYTIGGEGPEREYLEQLAGDLGIKDRVQFLGYVPDETKWSLLRRTDVFVMTSRVNHAEQHEGFGIVFLEAAAFGIPAIGTRAGGIPEAVVHGQTGLLVPQESPDSLADALTFLYENPELRKAMGEAGIRRARSHFSPTVIATYFQSQVSEREVLAGVAARE